MSSPHGISSPHITPGAAFPSGTEAKEGGAAQWTVGDSRGEIGGSPLSSRSKCGTRPLWIAPQATGWAKLCHHTLIPTTSYPSPHTPLAFYTLGTPRGRSRRASLPAGSQGAPSHRETAPPSVHNLGERDLGGRDLANLARSWAPRRRRYEQRVPLAQAGARPPCRHPRLGPDASSQLLSSCNIASPRDAADRHLDGQRKCRPSRTPFAARQHPNTPRRRIAPLPKRPAR